MLKNGDKKKHTHTYEMGTAHILFNVFIAPWNSSCACGFGFFTLSYKIIACYYIWYIHNLFLSSLRCFFFFSSFSRSLTRMWQSAVLFSACTTLMNSKQYAHMIIWQSDREIKDAHRSNKKANQVLSWHLQSLLNISDRVHCPVTSKSRRSFNAFRPFFSSFVSF